MEQITISDDDVAKLIQKGKLAAVAGTNGINYKFLKSTCLYSSLTSEIFTQSLLGASLPDDWRIAKVVSVHKSGDVHNPNNYRPISLTSILCKLLEHIIYSHLVDYLQSNSFSTDSQHGFRKHHSCKTQLTAFTNDLISVLDQCCHIDCIFIDFAKAFDTVSHELLLYKLSKLNIDSALLRWIQCFLSNRHQYITANNHDSPISPITYGLPQESVLGPLLFLIYINDLSSSITSKIRLFTNDCFILRSY